MLPIENRTLHRRLSVLVGLGVILLLFVVQGFDFQHHWHEWRYVFSAVNYDVRQLADGAFDPGPPPERSGEEVGAWYWGQLLHVAIVSKVMGLTGSGATGILVLQWLYGVFVFCAMAVVVSALRALPLNINWMHYSVITILGPLSVYIGFKLMAEGAALMFAGGAVALFTAGSTRQGLARGVLWALAVVCTSLSFLTMVYMPLLVFGFLVAWVVSSDESWPPVTSFSIFGFLILAIIACIFSSWLLFDVAVADYLAMYGFFRGYIKPLVTSLFGVVSAWGPLYLLMIVAIWHQHRKALRFFAVWSLAAIAPIAIFANNYVESRFLLVGYFGLAGLALLGLDQILVQLGLRRGKQLAAPVQVVATIGCTWIAAWLCLYFLPVEMSSRELRKAVEVSLGQGTDAVVLVPWNYTDFHYLSVAYPDDPVYLVQAPIDDDGEPVQDLAWKTRFKKTYGSRFLAGHEDMDVIADRELYLVGHGVIPPLSNLRAAADLLGLSSVVARIDAMNPKVHIRESWIWSHPAYTLTEWDRVGNYRIYRVTRNRPARS